MKKVILANLVVLLAVGSAKAGPRRDVKAIGEAAVRKGLISAPPKDHDFTKIPAGAKYVAGELLVRFAPKADGKQRSRGEKEAVLAAVGGGKVKRSYDIVPGLSLVRLPKGLSMEKAVKRFNGRVEIIYAEPNYEIQPCSTFPNDPRFDEQWSLHNTGQGGWTPDADIDAPEAWDIRTDAGEIIVAVLDTGFDREHEDLAGNLWINELEYNGTPGVDDDENGYVDDIHGIGDTIDDHGTATAGVIGAVGNNGKGVTGVCWSVQMMTVVGVGVDRIEYAVANGADVINASAASSGYNQAAKDAIAAAGSAGVLFVAAGGNDWIDTDKEPQYPACYDCDNIIAVGGISGYDEPLYNWGRMSLHISSPTGVLTCFPEDNYAGYFGTSCATPHVAGACALVWAEFPTLSHVEVKDIVLGTVEDLPGLEGLTRTGGRLNLYSALLGKKVKNISSGIWYDSIQEAINAAQEGDTIKVLPGTYEEKITFSNKAITVRSYDPDDERVVAGTIIDADSTGTAVTFDGADSVLHGFTITGGNSTHAGGIACIDSSPTIRNCVIEDNYASNSGGAMRTFNSSPTLINCTFNGNSAGYEGGGIYNSYSSVTVKNCTFMNNSAGDYGGAMVNRSQSTVTASNSIFSGNNAGYCGGAMDNWMSDLTVTNCVFYDNEATLSGGGAMLTNDCSLEAENCVFSHNWAGGSGGGAMYNSSATVSVTNCTLSNNSTTANGGGIYSNSGSPVVTNCILWGNSDAGGSGESAQICGGTPVVNYCCVQGWTTGLGGTGNIGNNPAFVNASDPNGADDVFMTADDGLALGSGSPCIDAGNNDAVGVGGDITGSYRLRDDEASTDSGGPENDSPYVDMGGYEYPGAARTIYVDVSASGGMYNGHSWGTALKALKEAVDHAIAGDEIRLAQGTYVVSSTIELDEEIDVYGGYDASTDERNWQLYVTTVDGGDEVRCFDVSADCSVDGLTVTGGHSYQGGGMYLAGCSPRIVNCAFAGNTAANSGGGMYAADSLSLTVQNCAFAGNTAGLKGGAMLNRDCTAAVTNCVFGENSAGAAGGGMYIMALEGQSSAAITNCTFSGNATNNVGGAVWKNGRSSVDLTNCILWGNTATVGGPQIYGDCVVSYSDVEGDWEGDGNIDADPCFVNAVGGDYHLLVDSPCINSGHPDTIYTGEKDIDGEPRVMAGTVDMGADEYCGVINIDNQFPEQQWYESIQAAIDDMDAEPGETIEAGPGTYSESIDFKGKAITVRSSYPDHWDVVEQTVIDATGKENGVGFCTSEGADAVLKGFAVKNSSGHGISISGSSPTIRNCIIENNASNGVDCQGAGAAPTIADNIIRDNGTNGVSCQGAGAAPTIANNIIRDNTSFGISCGTSSAPTIANNIIRDNTSFGILCGTSSAPTIKNNWIYGNSAGVMTIWAGSTVIRNNTVANNLSYYGIKAIGPAPTITNCIIWGNADDLSDCTATYSCIQNNDQGEGNIHDDPLFVDAANDDYHICTDSPCTEAGDPAPDYEDETDIDGQSRLLGETVDMGADEFYGVFNWDRELWYETIQGAIDNANADDEIVVYPDTYNEHIEFGSTAITVRSMDPDDASVVAATIIDGDGSGNVVEFDDDQGNYSELKGLTIRNGSRGIYCDDSSPTIWGCNITRNGGHGMRNRYGSSAQVTDCVFSGNNGGMENDDSSPSVTNCVFYDNSAGEHGGGICNEDESSPTITNCTFYANWADELGGGIYNEYYSEPTVTNCLFWGNDAGDDGEEIYNDDSEPTFSYCCVRGGVNGTYCGGDNSDNGGGNISDDPDFADDTDPEGTDNIWATCDDGLRLDSTSPCKDQGHNDFVPEGVDTDIKGSDRFINTTVDMGAYEYDSGC
ncbi:MAG: right-handed parallel beta-helix repeat-containing protein [Planctomycetota bacterium]|jgi:parallel beta-helix repeat protein